MFEDVLASVRIGAATVDTRIDQDGVRPGETLPAQVVVEGGETDQEIEGIELELKTKRERGDSRQTFEIDSFHVADAFTIHEGEKRVFDVDLDVHLETPVTTMDVRRDRSAVWIDTDLEIDRAIDADDTDYLDVHPTAPMEAMLEGVSRSGFELHEVTVDADSIEVNNELSRLRLDQEFVFRPTGSSDLSELEVHFLPREEETHVLLEFDHRYHDENFGRVRIDHDDYDVDSLRVRLESYL